MSGFAVYSYKVIPCMHLAGGDTVHTNPVAIYIIYIYICVCVLCLESVLYGDKPMWSTGT